MSRAVSRNRLAALRKPLLGRAARLFAAGGLALLLASCAAPLPPMNQLPAIPQYGAEPLSCKKPPSCVVSAYPGQEGEFRAAIQNKKMSGGACCAAPVPLSYDGAVGADSSATPTGPESFDLGLTAADLTRTVEQALQKVGCTIAAGQNDYITRDQRLSVNRIVVPRVVQTHYLRGREGAYQDALVELIVYDARTGAELGRASAWGRSDRAYADAVRNAVGNVTTLTAFHDILCPD
jgi:hypothetical protein